MKFIIHNSDLYYPSVEEYDDYVSAMKKFSELKAERIRESKHEWCGSEKDYLAIVISEIDIEKLKKITNGGELDGIDGVG